jgi:hypothetical protein
VSSSTVVGEHKKTSTRQLDAISYAQQGTGHASRNGKICADEEDEFERWLERM